MPNFKFLASAVPEIWRGSKNSKSRSRDPLVTPIDLIFISSVSSPRVPRSNIQTAITPLRIARLGSNLEQSLTMVQPAHYKSSRSKVKGQGHSVT